MGNKERLVMPMWLGGREIELPQWQVDAMKKWNLSMVGTQEEMLKTLRLIPDKELAERAAKTLVEVQVIKEDLMKDPLKHFIPSAALPLPKARPITETIKVKSLFTLEKKENGRDFRLNLGDEVMDFLKSIPEEQRFNVKLRFIPKDRTEAPKNNG